MVGYRVARARTLAYALVAFAVALSLTSPASALAITFTNQYPVGPVQAPPQILGVTAFSPIALDARGAQIAVDGTAYATQVRTGSTSGYWSATEVWNVALQAWTIKWTWVPTAADPNKTTLYAYPVFSPPLANGIHTVTATIKDKNGVATTDTWTFTYNAAPVLGAPTPGDGAVVETITPAISIPVSGSGALSATSTVNGAPVSATVSAGVVSLASSTLPNDATTTVTVAVTDASGNRTSRTWAFYVQALPEMPTSDGACEGCHTGVTGHSPGEDCLTCHNGTPFPAPHPGEPSTYHAKADVQNCKPCHVSDITIEHTGRTTQVGDEITCLTCHNASRQNVVAAIAAGDTRCSACHDYHAVPHANTRSTCAGVGCHNGTHLVAVHAAISCAACHSSTDTKVAAAIAGHDRDCIACHNPVAVHGAVHEASASYAGAVGNPKWTGDGPGVVGYVKLTCLSCHRSNLLANHGSDYGNCVTCHASGAPATSLAGWDGSCQTGACHPVTSYQYVGNDPAALPVAPHRAPASVMDHHVVASGYQAPPYCNQCHNTPAAQCGGAYGCHVGVVPPATSVDFKAPTTVASQVTSSPITWTLTATDVGDGVVTTYYSFDGADFRVYGTAEKANGISNPADASPPYVHTLRFYSVDAANHVESTQTVEYNVTDSAPPVVSFNGLSLGGGTFVAKSLVMSVSDPKVNGFSTGVSTIYTEVRTFKTNWGWFPYQAFYQPMATFTYPVDGTWDSTRTLPAFEEYAKAKSSPGLWPTYQDFGGGSGRFEMQYYARDFSGNQTPLTYAYIWIDNSPPTTTPAQVSAGVYRWRFSSYDAGNSGVKSTYYSFDGAPFAPYTPADSSAGVANTNPGGEASGAHSLQYYSVDNLGNTEATMTLNYSIP